MDTKSIKTLEEIANLLGVTIGAKTESELMDLYDASLDEMGDVEIGGFKYGAAYTLKEVDPTAYRTGFSDWLDAEGYYEISNGWMDADDLDELKEKIKTALATGLLRVAARAERQANMRNTDQELD